MVWPSAFFKGPAEIEGLPMVVWPVAAPAPAGAADAAAKPGTLAPTHLAMHFAWIV